MLEYDGALYVLGNKKVFDDQYINTVSVMRTDGTFERIYDFSYI